MYLSTLSKVKFVWNGYKVKCLKIFWRLLTKNRLNFSTFAYCSNKSLYSRVLPYLGLLRIRYSPRKMQGLKRARMLGSILSAKIKNQLTYLATQ